MGNQCSSNICCLNEKSNELTTDAKKDLDFSSHISGLPLQPPIVEGTSLPSCQKTNPPTNRDSTDYDQQQAPTKIEFENGSVYTGNPPGPPSIFKFFLDPKKYFYRAIDGWDDQAWVRHTMLARWV